MEKGDTQNFQPKSPSCSYGCDAYVSLADIIGFQSDPFFFFFLPILGAHAANHSQLHPSSDNCLWPLDTPNHLVSLKKTVKST